MATTLQLQQVSYTASLVSLFRCIAIMLLLQFILLSLYLTVRSISTLLGQTLYVFTTL